MKISIKQLFAVVIMITTLVSCSDAGDQEADLNIRLTDAPGFYNAVNVDIQDVEVNVDDEWNSVIVNPGIYNLLDFTNGKDTLLASSAIDAGTVSQIRLILGTNNTVELTNGQTYDLKTPSAQQSGLKLLVNQELEPGITYNFILDFDAEQSVVETGNDKYLLKPTIKVILADNSGSISGIVEPASSNSVVYAIDGIDSSSTYPDAIGAFTVSGLAPGTYDVLISPTAGGYSDETIEDVNVTEEQNTDLGIIDLN